MPGGVPPKVVTQEEGVEIARRTTLNFRGDNVTVEDDAANGRVNVNITGGVVAADVSAIVDAAIGVHVSGADPHTVYQLEASISTPIDAAITNHVSSDRHVKTFEIALQSVTGSQVTGTGLFFFPIPPALDGMNLIDADAWLNPGRMSASGTPTYMIHNATPGVTGNMLSTAITIDVSEYNSYSAATPAVVDVSMDGVSTGMMLRLDKTVKGVSEEGDGIVLVFKLP